MPNRKELSRAYQAGYNCMLFGPDMKNCHYRHFSSSELTKTWEQGSFDAMLKQQQGNEQSTKVERKTYE